MIDNGQWTMDKNALAMALALAVGLIFQDHEVTISKKNAVCSCVIQKKAVPLQAAKCFAALRKWKSPKKIYVIR